MDTTAPVAPSFVVKPFRLLPFRGLRFAPSSVGDPGSARAFARPYRDVPRRLRSWTARGRLVHDAEPALYVHEYTADGVTVRGVVGALDLSRTSDNCPGAQQAVFPHEGVHQAQVAQLARRMQQMGLNPAPILLVHHGPPDSRPLVHQLTTSPPDTAFEDRLGQWHRLWALRDPEVVAALTERLMDTHALIADGHHRYAGYLQLQHANPGTAWDRGLAMLVDQDDTPMWLGPIHRFLSGVRLTSLVEAVSGHHGVSCEVTTHNLALDSLAPHVLAVTDGTAWAVVRLPAPSAADAASPDDGGELAVTVFERDLLPRLGGRTPVSYHHTVDDVVKRAQSRRGVAVLMPAPGFDAVLRSASAGELLPEKATSFQPKPSLGVLMRNLRDERADRS